MSEDDEVEDNKPLVFETITKVVAAFSGPRNVDHCYKMGVSLPRLKFLEKPYTVED